MKTLYKLVIGIVLTTGMSDAFGQKIVGKHYLRSSQVVEIQDNANNKTYHLTIQMPYGYENAVKNGQKYPTMYVTDKAYNFPMVEGWMQVATHNNTIQKNILVGISWEINTKSRISRSYIGVSTNISETV